MEFLRYYASVGGVSFDLNSDPIRRLESQAAQSFGAKYCLALSSGTAALHCAFVALDVRPGNEVIFPNYTFYRTVTPALLHGVIPVLVDSEPDSENIDTGRLEKFITPATRGIVVTHMMGHPCDLSRTWDVARRHHLWVVEDASHAHGAEINGQRIGAGQSAAVCFSLQGKKIVAAGQGGLLCTPHRELFEKSVLLAYFRPRLREDVSDDRFAVYLDSGFGLNYQMHPLGAVLATGHLQRLPSTLRQRQCVCEELCNGLANLRLVRPPTVRKYVTSHSWYRFRPVFSDDEIDIDYYGRALRAEGVHLRVKRDRLLHEEPILNGEASYTPPYAEYLKSQFVLRDDYRNSSELARRTIEIDLPIDRAVVAQYVQAFKKVDVELPDAWRRVRDR